MTVKVSRSILVLLVAGAAAQALAQGAPSPEEVYRRLSPSIWLVRVYDADGLATGTGSAVVVAPETLLTNCHVLRKSKRITVLNDNTQHEAKLQHVDVDRDLCQVTARNLRAPAVAIGDSDAIAEGQKVYALGNPRGLERTFSDGLVSALRRSDNTRELMLIQTTAPISPGSSGGGLFDLQGRLVGITTLQLRESQNLNFAVPINWLRDLPARSDAALQASAKGTASAPAGSTDVTDTAAIPVDDRCREEYRKYVVAPTPKAFAIATGGKCAWQQSRKPSRPQLTDSPDPAVRAMELCVHWHGTGCTLYAVDGRVVYKR